MDYLPRSSDGHRFAMEDSEIDSLRQRFLNNLKRTFGSQFDAIVEEFTEATTLEDKMKVSIKFKEMFGACNQHDQLYAHIENKTNFKCPLESARYRVKGNLEYQAKKNKEALRLYNKSIAYAPINSMELALAYANRSAVLRSMQRCRECLVDIERALNLGYPPDKSFKLLLREMQCHRDLGNMTDANTSSLKALQLLQTLVGVTEEQKTAMKQQLDTGKKLPRKEVSQVEIFFPTEVPELSYGESSDIVGASSAVKLEYNEQQGRHLVADRDINIGDVLLIAENLVVTLNDDFRYDHCAHCHKLGYNLIPCPNCYWMLFCSEECQTEANQKYHNVECIAYSRFRYITMKSLMNRKDIFCRIIRLFSIIGVNNLQPYFKYVRSQYDEASKRNKTFDSTDFEAIFNMFSMKKDDAVQTDLLMSSSTALQIPRCFGLSLEHADYFAIIALFVHLEFITLVNSTAKCYTNFLNPTPLEIQSPGLCFNPLMSLLNHCCLMGNTHTVHYGNKQVVLAKWPIKKGSVLTFSYVPLWHEWSREERQKYLKSECMFDCKCIVCEENWNFINTKQISDDADLKLASDLFDHNENMLIDIHRCYLRDELASQMETFVTDRRDLLTKLWNKGEFFDVHCLEMQIQLEMYQNLQGNRLMNMVDYSSVATRDQRSVIALIEAIKRKNPPKNIEFTDYAVPSFQF